jgi:hypothetical protein
MEPECSLPCSQEPIENILTNTGVITYHSTGQTLGTNMQLTAKQ